MNRKYLRPHPEGFITDSPLNAHAELTLEGWFLVAGWRAAFPEPPEGAVDLYAKDAKGAETAWLISTDPDAATWDEFERFRETLADLTEPQRRYMMSMARWLSKDDSGRILERLKRHENGERVTTDYFDMDSGERRHIPWSESVPERCRPILGELEVNHV